MTVPRSVELLLRALPVASTVLRSHSHTEDRAMRTGSQPKALAWCLCQAAPVRVGLIAGSSSASLSVCFPGEACPLASHYFGFHYSYVQEFSCSWGLEVKGLLVGLCALFKEHSPVPSLPRERWPILELGNRLSQGCCDSCEVRLPDRPSLVDRWHSLIPKVARPVLREGRPVQGHTARGD